jgi:hypothetical protein
LQDFGLVEEVFERKKSIDGLKWKITEEIFERRKNDSIFAE